MNELYVTKSILHTLFSEAMLKAVTVVPRDVREALERAQAQEPSELTRQHYKTTLENLDVGIKMDFLACPDTGWPLFFVRAGDNVKIENGFSSLYEVSKKVVRELTAGSKYRQAMSHPVTRAICKDNIGYYFPHVEIQFDPKVDFLEVIAVPKGGGSEIFGSFFRQLFVGDGMQGVTKFILDCAKESTYAGKTCPPNVIGIGIGGTGDMCMKIAKEAAVLRPIGKRHPDADIAKLEIDLLKAINSLGRGHMGAGGIETAFDVHIEIAVCHTAALPVAFNAQCCLARRATAKLQQDGTIVYGDQPSWEYR